MFASHHESDPPRPRPARLTRALTAALLCVGAWGLAACQVGDKYKTGTEDDGTDLIAPPVSPTSETVSADEPTTITVGTTTLRFPAGAIQDAVQIRIEVVDHDVPPPSGSVFNEDIWSFSPHGIRFDAPVRVTMSAGGLDGATGTVLKLDGPDDEEWAVVPGATWDPSNDEVGFIIDSFSYYTVAGGEPDNRPPVANAGDDVELRTGETAIIDGSGSSDPDADTLTYTWTMLSAPSGSNAANTLTGTTTDLAQFATDLPGTYELSLVVHDGLEESNTDIVRVLVVDNIAPVADAGADIDTRTGQTVVLDGTASWDGNGDPLSYTWWFTETPGASDTELTAISSSQPRFVADEPGTYRVTLNVDDTYANASDEVEIEVIDNAVPVADPGPDLIVPTGSRVTLDGSDSSDADGDSISYTWTLLSRPAGSNAVLDGISAIEPSFTADLGGSYIISLSVDDGFDPSTVQTVTVIANLTPVADAGTDQADRTGQTIELDGSGSSDPDGDDLTYAWSIQSGPVGAAAWTSTEISPSFTPLIEGVYTLALVVSDDIASSPADTVTITLVDNQIPVADAGSDESEPISSLITLDGSNSSDGDGDALSYLWTFITKPGNSQALLSSSTAVQPTFTVDRAGTYQLSLVVDDGYDVSSPDLVTITVEPNIVPVADAGVGGSGRVGVPFPLDGSGSYDDNGDPITYHWSFFGRPGGSMAEVDNADQAHASFTPDVRGNYVIRLTVDDGLDESEMDLIVISVSVNNAPVADAGVGGQTSVGATVSLDGTSSSDRDGDSLTYIWELASTPSGSTAALSDTGSPQPDFVADVAGLYIVHLIVHDGWETSAVATVAWEATAD